jgi:hypothetical protein
MPRGQGLHALPTLADPAVHAVLCHLALPPAAHRIVAKVRRGEDPHAPAVEARRRKLAVLMQDVSTAGCLAARAFWRDWRCHRLTSAAQHSPAACFAAAAFDLLLADPCCACCAVLQTLRKDRKVTDLLHLKIGAQVMCTANLGCSLVNGSRGVVVGFVDAM